MTSHDSFPTPVVGRKSRIAPSRRWRSAEPVDRVGGLHRADHYAVSKIDVRRNVAARGVGLGRVVVAHLSAISPVKEDFGSDVAVPVVVHVLGDLQQDKRGRNHRQTLLGANGKHVMQEGARPFAQVSFYHGAHGVQMNTALQCVKGEGIE